MPKITKYCVFSMFTEDGKLCLYLRWKCLADGAPLWEEPLGKGEGPLSPVVFTRALGTYPCQPRPKTPAAYRMLPNPRSSENKHTHRPLFKKLEFENEDTRRGTFLNFCPDSRLESSSHLCKIDFKQIYYKRNLVI